MVQQSVPADKKKILYLDAMSGISGDMLLGALVDAGVPFDLLEKTIASLKIANLTCVKREIVRGGFRATKIDVLLPHEHTHRHLSDILDIIQRADMSAKAKETAIEIFQRLAEAEGKAHGKDPREVHFHEVGAADSIADILGLSVGFAWLDADKIYCSPIATGTGTVEIAHGICPIPAPAVAELLRGIPSLSTEVPFELATPTGVAAVSVLAQEFGPMPSMTIETVGLGAGTREIPGRPNLLRLIVGYEVTGALTPGSSDPVHLPEGSHVHQSGHCNHSGETESLWMLETNLDDMTGESLAWLIEKLWALNPRDVFTIPIQMKKQRPGVLISVLTGESQIAATENVLFRESTTLGIRRRRVERTELPRREVLVETPWGKVPGKEAVLPDGTIRFKPEYEVIAALARTNNVPLETIRTACLAAARAGESDSKTRECHHHDHHCHHDHHDHNHHEERA